MNVIAYLPYEEADLVSSCIRQERWAQKKLYEDHYSFMMSICLRYTSNENDALDLMHEGFIKIFTNIHKYQPETALSAWMRRIMINNCIDYYRKMSRRRTEDLDEAFKIEATDADAISQFSEKEILAAIQKLPPTYRTVFNLYILEGFSHKEIGDQLGITESTSRSNLVKARAKLRGFLAGKENND
jgi:RNA polymerase sigma-70 factor (ECF subfamily)